MFSTYKPTTLKKILQHHKIQFWQLTCWVSISAVTCFPVCRALGDGRNLPILFLRLKRNTTLNAVHEDHDFWSSSGGMTSKRICSISVTLSAKIKHKHMGNLRVSGGEGRNRQENYLSCNTACLHIQFTVVIYTRCIYNLNVWLFFFSF